METVTVAEIEEVLKKLPPEKLAEVLDFARFLAVPKDEFGAMETMIASERVLGRDWLRPEEDEAWGDL